MKISFILKLTSQNRFLDAQYSWQTISIFPRCVYFLFQGVSISQNFWERRLNQIRSLLIFSQGRAWSHQNGCLGTLKYIFINMSSKNTDIWALVVCWQGFMWITCLMTWLYANQESDYATHHGRSPRYVLKNWLTSEQRNIITHILDFCLFF